MFTCVRYCYNSLVNILDFTTLLRNRIKDYDTSKRGVVVFNACRNAFGMHDMQNPTVVTTFWKFLFFWNQMSPYTETTMTDCKPRTQYYASRNGLQIGL